MCRSRSESHKRKIGGVENRNDDDRSEIIDDREAQQKNPQARNDMASYERQHADRKGDIRRRRNRPTRQGARAVDVDGGIDRRWNRHTADGADDWKRRAPPIGEFTFEQLAFDLEPDQQEEHRHQRIVDPEVNGFFETKTIESDANASV